MKSTLHHQLDYRELEGPISVRRATDSERRTMQAPLSALILSRNGHNFGAVIGYPTSASAFVANRGVSITEATLRRVADLVSATAKHGFTDGVIEDFQETELARFGLGV